MCCDMTGYSIRVLDWTAVKWSLSGEWRELGL